MWSWHGMCRAEAILKFSLTGALKWIAILWPFMEPIWTLESLNTKIAGNGGIPSSHAVFKRLNAYNAMGLKNQNITVNLHGALKWMEKWILHNRKQRRANRIPTLSSTQIVREIIKQTLISVLSGGTDSTIIGTAGKNKKYVRTGVNQFTQSWAVYHHDLQQLKTLLTKCSQEQSHHQYYPRDPIVIQYYIHSRTSVVGHPIYY